MHLKFDNRNADYFEILHNVHLQPIYKKICEFWVEARVRGESQVSKSYSDTDGYGVLPTSKIKEGFINLYVITYTNVCLNLKNVQNEISFAHTVRH